ncbi:uncharacterized protein LOC124146599 [Haliotis rufescens]|uniref:uncharacterized protein LOC124146599 n=1 Tax=Haliotis rufescens TaxID=6454 RepID=UPI00201F48A2|nr:uncharacterized protein LOC124146599 [Haliotis rufescens]
MMSSPLLQPLFVDINITYELDMSKFPGLDDPQHMYQPALLIESPESRVSWISVLSEHGDVAEDAWATSDVDDDIGYTYSGHSHSIEEDLYTLIDSCNLSPPSGVTKSPPNDVILALPSDDELDLLEMVYDSPNTDVHMLNRTGCFDSVYHQDNYYLSNDHRGKQWRHTESSCDDVAALFREPCATEGVCQSCSMYAAYLGTCLHHLRLDDEMTNVTPRMSSDECGTRSRRES